MEISGADNFPRNVAVNRGHTARVKGEVKSRKILFLRVERVRQTIFWKDPQSRECKVREKTEMNVIQGTDEGTASGRNLEILRIVFNFGLM